MAFLLSNQACLALSKSPLLTLFDPHGQCPFHGQTKPLFYSLNHLSNLFRPTRTMAFPLSNPRILVSSKSPFLTFLFGPQGQRPSHCQNKPSLSYLNHLFLPFRPPRTMAFPSSNQAFLVLSKSPFLTFSTHTGNGLSMAKPSLSCIL